MPAYSWSSATLNAFAWAGVTVGSCFTIMFGVAPFWKNWLLCPVIRLSASISRTSGVSHDMPR